MLTNRRELCNSVLTTKDSQTIIDLIFANNNKTVQVIHEPKIMDRVWLKVELSVSKNKSKYR